MAGKQAHKVNPLQAPGRRAPKQERSKKTVRLILDTTLDILEEEGFSGVTMQKIADRAGINVAAVYGYFPNKHHVVAELNRRMFTRRNEIQRQHYEELLQREGNWVDNLAESLRELARLRTAQRGSAALRSAMRASPALWHLNQENLDKAAVQFAKYLGQVDPDYPGDQELRARIIAEAVVAVLDLAQASDEETSQAMLNELVAMIRGYLKSASA